MDSNIIIGYTLSSILVVGICILLATQLIDTRLKLKQSKLLYDKLLSQKKSSEVRLGQISENLAPFLAEFKYNPKKCHFLGNPIDYIIFEDDKIVFLEIKSGESRLSDTQKNIKKIIESKEVYFDTMRIN
jgi:predicted Holliday junction resolvase-like endonuclease